MPKKSCIRYHRFSSKDQSNGSIERQEVVTDYWCRQNDVAITATYIDDGYSAKTFDRPDIKKLFDFIKEQKSAIDYLIVSELTRFSRELGEAITMVKQIQKLYGIKIVSAGRNMIYDCNDHASFFMMSIEFTMGNTENLKRESDINGGIYTAKTKEQRFIGSRAPYGYKKEGDRIKHLVIKEEEAAVVKFIYESYLRNVPIKMIYADAKKMGFKNRGNSVIAKLVANPIYSAQQMVRPWKDMPGGLYPARHEAIIDIITWNQVQHKLKVPKRPGVSVSDNFPLKNTLHCHCGRMLTGAPSKGKLGVWYDYYKCNSPRHLNLSAKKAHAQLQEMLVHLSVPDDLIHDVQQESLMLMEEQLQENKKLLVHHERLHAENEKKIHSLEDKYISNKISFEAYNRWHGELISQRMYLKAKIQELSVGGNEIYFLLEQNLEALTNMPAIYNLSSTIQKQELLNTVFDNRLYYRSGTYRTPYIMPLFEHNTLILNQKKLLIIDEEKGETESLPVGGQAGNIIELGGTEPSFRTDQQGIEPLYQLLSLIQSIRVA